MTIQARDVFDTAADMEKAGADLYRDLARTHAGDQRLSEFFSYLASEEEQHRKVFEETRETVPDFSYADYDAPVKEELRAFARVFSRSRLSDERGTLTDLVSAVDFAIRREMDSIFFYDEMVGHVPGPQRDRIMEIILQERKHFRELTELRAHIARED
jgi:rubrerythrin